MCSICSEASGEDAWSKRQYSQRPPARARTSRLVSASIWLPAGEDAAALGLKNRHDFVGSSVSFVLSELNGKKSPKMSQVPMAMYHKCEVENRESKEVRLPELLSGFIFSTPPEDSSKRPLYDERYPSWQSMQALLTAAAAELAAS